jgi:hypothetical protein
VITPADRRECEVAVTDEERIAEAYCAVRRTLLVLDREVAQLKHSEVIVPARLAINAMYRVEAHLDEARQAAGHSDYR